MKAFLEEKKVYQIMRSFSPMFLMYTQVYQSEKVSLLIDCGISHQKYL